MRTIQEVLRDCNRRELLNTYNFIYPVTSCDIPPDIRDRTIRELLETREKNINGMIDRMLEMTPDKGEEKVFFVRRIMSVDNKETDFVLARVSDVLDESIEYVERCGCILDTHEKMMSYYVAETPTTKYYLYDLLVDFIRNASFLGFRQEGLKEVTEVLDAVDPDEEGIPAEEVFDKLREEFGIEKEDRDSREEEAYRNTFGKMMEHVVEYNVLAGRIEAEKVREIIRKEKEKTSQGVKTEEDIL